MLVAIRGERVKKLSGHHQWGQKFLCGVSAFCHGKRITPKGH